MKPNSTGIVELGPKMLADSVPARKIPKTRGDCSNIQASTPPDCSKRSIIGEGCEAQRVWACGFPSVVDTDSAGHDLPIWDPVSAQVKSQLHYVIRQERGLLTIIGLLAECAPLMGQQVVVKIIVAVTDVSDAERGKT